MRSETSTLKSTFHQGIRSSKNMALALEGIIGASVVYTVFRILYLRGVNLFLNLALCFALTAACYVAARLVNQKMGGLQAVGVRIKKNGYAYFAFGAVAVLMLFLFLIYEVRPFGGQAILRMDLYHQYGPLFGELYDRVAEGKSLLYSWQSGGGSSFLGNFFNYLSSPFAFIIFWFQRVNVVDAIAYMILLKAALSAFTFTWYLKKTQKRCDPTTAAFGILYAFCAFFIAYYWNLMWIDAMVLLPVLLYGIERIIKKGKMSVYVVSLCLVFFSNYYMAYMVCLFSVIYFLVYYFSHYSLTGLTVPDGPELSPLERIRYSRFLNHGMRFAIGSLIAAALMAVTLLPTYFTLQATSATSGSFPNEMETYFNIFDFIANHLASVDPTIRSSGGEVQPNVYCGVIALLLIPLYSMSKGIKLREKISFTVLLAVFLLSFNTNYLNFIWHGFHFPNDLPYRFSFMYSFILLVMGYKVLRQIKSFSVKHIAAIGTAVLFFILLTEKLGAKYVDTYTIIISLILVAVYTLLLAAYRSKKLAYGTFSVVLLCAVCTEVILADIPRFEITVDKANYTSDFEDYRNVIDDIAEMDDGSYRVELSNIPTGLRMSPSWYNYNGVSTFSSMAYENVSGLQFNLGMFGNRINSYTYHTQTPVYNAMFGIKYVVENNYMVKLNDDLYTMLYEPNEQLTVYRNEYSLPFAFAVGSDLAYNWNTSSTNPFDVQNDFIYEATGVQDVFKRVEVDATGFQNCSISNFVWDADNYFTVQDPAQSASINANFTVPETANVYVYIKTRELQNTEFKTDRFQKTQSIGVEPYILDLGEMQEGEKVDMVSNITSDKASGSLDYFVYTLDMDAWERAYAILNNSGAMDITEWTDTKISGTVTMGSGELLYTSIPYDEGWTVYVDGNETATTMLGNALLGVNMTEGTHTVEFKYTPKGMALGAVISITVFGLFALFFLIKRYLIYRIGKAMDAMMG